MLKCVICNQGGWVAGDLIRPNCSLCMLKRKRPLPEVSIELFAKLAKLDQEVLEAINTDAHERFKAFREYGIIGEWNSERIFAEYIEAAGVLERTGVPINIPLTINESDYYRLNFHHYSAPREESSNSQNPGQFGRGRPPASSLPQSAALRKKAA